MRAATDWVTAASFALMAAACSPGGAGPAEGAQTEVAGTVSLVETPRLSADIEAMPRLSGSSPAIARINAGLDRSDASAVENAEACRASSSDGQSGEWVRSITRPMTGPAYVTLREHLEIYCGGAYPSTSRTAVTYDVSTGQRIDWTKAIPGLGLKVGSMEDMPPDYVPLVSSAALGAWYSRKMLANPEAEWVEQCRDVFDPADLADQSFNIWADAGNGGVTVAPDFAHVIQACADSATLTPAELTGFNASPELVEAITAARAAGNWAPKDDAATAAPKT